MVQHPRRNRISAVSYYGILDSGYVSSKAWETKLLALARGGAGLIQIRAKKESSAERAVLLKRAIDALSDSPFADRIPLILNDDIAVCLDFKDVGLHVGQDDLPPEEARDRLGPERVLGLSTHSTRQAGKAMALGPGTLDYFAVGPVFATPTKPDYEPVGLELVRWVASQSPALPFFCIGGIDRRNVGQVAKAGAQRVVTVSDALLSDDTTSAVAETISALQAVSHR